MSIDGIKGALASIPGIRSLDELTRPSDAPQSTGFAGALKDAMSELNHLQSEADSKIEGMALGKPNITPHEAMIAMEKADVAFTLMTTIKAKIIQAYQEVLRTQV